VTLNYIDTTISAGLNAASDICVHAISGNTNDWIITYNTILHGGASFGIEVGDFGGNPTQRMNVTGNNIKLTWSGSFGGISIGGNAPGTANSHFVVSGNTLDATGYGFTGHLIEVYGDHGTVTGNTCNAGTQTISNISIIGGDPCQFCVIANNTITGIFNGASTNCYGIQLIESQPSAYCIDNIVSGNVIQLSGTGSPIGIAVQNNHASGTTSNNTVVGNSYFGTNSGDKGIWIAELAGGTCSNNYTFNNVIINCATPYTIGSSTIGANDFTSVTTTGATAGSNGDVPAQVVGYLEVTIAGAVRKIPFYQ
jgi:hypothetical protein